jgi:hypothetical protein
MKARVDQRLRPSRAAGHANTVILNGARTDVAQLAMMQMAEDSANA